MGVIAVLVAIDAKADLDVSSKYALIQLAEKAAEKARLAEAAEADSITEASKVAELI